MNKNVGLMLKQRAVVSTHTEAFVEPSTNVRATGSVARSCQLSTEHQHRLAEPPSRRRIDEKTPGQRPRRSTCARQDSNL